MTAAGRLLGLKLRRVLHAVGCRMGRGLGLGPSKQRSARLPDDFHHSALVTFPWQRRLRSGRSAQALRGFRPLMGLWTDAVRLPTGPTALLLRPGHTQTRSRSRLRPGLEGIDQSAVIVRICRRDINRLHNLGVYATPVGSLLCRRRMLLSRDPGHRGRRGPNAVNRQPAVRMMDQGGTVALEIWADVATPRFTSAVASRPHRLPWGDERRFRQATPVKNTPPESCPPAVETIATPGSSDTEAQATAVDSARKGWPSVERPGYELLPPGPHLAQPDSTHHTWRRMVATGTDDVAAIMDAPRGTLSEDDGDGWPARLMPDPPSGEGAAAESERQAEAATDTNYAPAGPRDAGGVTCPSASVVGVMHPRAPPPSPVFGLPRSGSYRGPWSSRSSPVGWSLFR